MRYILAIVCSLVCCMVVAQQPLPLRFEHITTNNGLSNNTVLSINQDHDGFMWFGTEDGLNKYDGSNFKTYRHKEKDSLSLAGNNIADIVQDRYNPSRMWVSSHCSGLSNFNPYDGRSIKYTENEKGSTQLKSNCEIAVLYDNDGNTWVKNRRSLSLFNKQNNTFKTVFTDDSSIIYSFVVQGDNIWMGLGTCVKTYNTKTGQVVKYHLSKDGISPAFYSPRLVTATGEIICGSWQLGMCIFNPQTKSKKYFFDNAIVNSITEITILNRKQLWVASNHGLFVADIANGYTSLNEKSFTCYLPNITDPYTISSKNTTTIFQDRNGIIWVGTSDNGINKLVPNYLNFQQRQMFSSNNLWNTFANETPLDALIEQENGKTVYWFNYWYGGGLMKADENFQVIDRISFKHELPEWQKENRSLIVSKILRYGKDTLCLATWDGLWLYNDKQKKLLHNYKLNDSDSTQPKKIKVYIHHQG